MRFARVFIKIALIFIFLILAYEIVLLIQGGPAPSEPILSLFNYNYVDIYKKFFKKVILPDGNIIYKPQRKPNLSIEFPAHKREGTKRIFIIGGSVVFLTFKDSSYIRNMLQGLFPKIRFEIINCGMPGYDSYREKILVEEVLDYEPDLIILMSGNNEFYEPVRISLLAYNINRLLRRTWVFRKFQDGMLNVYKKKAITRNYRLINFEKNLRIIVEKIKKKNIYLIICTLPVNFRDCPPAGALPLQDTYFFDAWGAFEHKDFKKAINAFEQFLVTNPGSSFGYYFLAKSYDFLKDYPNARMYYLKALALDSDIGTRCTPERNEIILKLSKERNVILTDLEEAFVKIAPHGLLGREQFMDNCHWWSEYNCIVHEEIVKSIMKLYANISASTQASISLGRHKNLWEEPLNLNKKAFEAAKTAFGGLCGYSELFFNERTIAFLETAYILDPSIFNNIPALKKKIFEDISTSFFGTDILPDFEKYWPIFLYHAAENFRRIKLFSNAIRYSNEAISLKPQLVEIAYLVRGLSSYKIGQIEEAHNDFNRANKESLCKSLIQLYVKIFYNN